MTADNPQGATGLDVRDVAVAEHGGNLLRDGHCGSEYEGWDDHLAGHMARVEPLVAAYNMAHEGTRKPPALDVERLAEALKATAWSHDHDGADVWAGEIAAEYNRLAGEPDA